MSIEQNINANEGTENQDPTEVATRRVFEDGTVANQTEEEYQEELERRREK